MNPQVITTGNHNVFVRTFANLQRLVVKTLLQGALVPISCKD